MKAKGFAWTGLALLVLLVFVSFPTTRVAAQENPPPDLPYKVYVPSVSRSGSPAYFGLAMAVDQPDDLTILNVTWFYNWTDNPKTSIQGIPSVPMAYTGRTNRLDHEYNGWLLVFNEPNNIAPYGCDLDPVEAAKRYVQLRSDLPNAKLVVGGWSVFARDWIQGFVNELKAAGEPLPQYWHAHAYTEAWITPEIAQAYLREYHQLTGGTYWITEYGSPEGSLEDFQKMTAWFQNQNWIERVSAYTNRQPDSAGWAIGTGVELMAEGLETTPIGDYFAGEAVKRR